MLYSYDGKFYFVPKEFEFPNDMKRKAGWRLWLMGTCFRGKDKVRRFRSFNGSSVLPTNKMKTQLYM